MAERRDLANAVRVLSMDAVQQANSGHPGAPMGMADMAEVLWNDFLSHNPGNPNWANRDRFVLSNGHGSMLLYSLLHLSGYDLPIEELKNFRQLHSKTPGHPEYGYAPGVETTTGPLGQGIANAVGMALAERTLAAQFNQGSHHIVDHHTYCFMGDGCLMEGISHEVCSLAGTLKLGKLIALWDDNGISIDGEVEGWFTDNTPERIEAYGWQVIRDVDGHDAGAISNALATAKSDDSKPTLICCRTTIGFGAPTKAGTASSHGSPLGDDEIAAARETFGWSHPPFDIPTEVRTAWDATAAGAQREKAWQTAFDAYAKDHPELAAEFTRRMSGAMPANWSESADAFVASVVEKGETIASRKASQNALNGFGPLLPEMLGGSADLAGSNNTLWSGSVGVKDDDAGNYIHYGVREFGMSAMQNGIVLHGGFKPYCATFLMFSEYARNALRMAALMKLPGIFVYTHDSIGVGEDGPTHQPVEQTATLRLIPNMSVWRPCDAVESAVAWRLALERQENPISLIFSRQNLAHQNRSAEQIANVAKGGYVLFEPASEPKSILIATGSEVGLAMDAAAALNNSGVPTRVVSMPSTDTFDAQESAYKNAVLPPHITARVAVEAGATDLWRKYVGLTGDVLGMDTFGESGPGAQVFEHFGFTVDGLTQKVQAVIDNN